ncbi:Ferredoxin [Rhodococcus sp. WAY2]|nr:hypothetical protein [Rhodococcus sp. WAY2]QHE71038.1 Ferredoxin [Rhodococcus sp. WAY2]
MSTAEQMLESYPKKLRHIDQAALLACIGARAECAQTCTACADACPSEPSVADLTACIRTDLDCAAACLRCERAGRELFSALD